MSFFQLGGSIYNTCMFSSMEELSKPIPNKFGGDPITHVLKFMPEHIESEWQKKGKFLTEKQALDVGVVLLSNGAEVPTRLAPKVKKKSPGGG